MSMIRDYRGKISVMRVCIFILVVSVMGVFILHNIVSVLKGGGFVSVGTNEAILLAGVFGAKSIQSISEKGSIEKKEDCTRTM